MSALSAMLSTNIGCHKKFGQVSNTECTSHGNDYKLIPMVKMETRHPVDKSFEFISSAL